MVSTFKLGFSLLLGIFFLNTLLACRILSKNQAVTFVFEETFENHTSGTKLPGEIRVAKERNEKLDIIQVISNDTIVAKYIKAEFNPVCECVQFYLREDKTLSDYRNEKWKPSLEYEFQLSCESRSAPLNYTYMLGIKDENLYPPKFNSSSYEIELVYTSLYGYKIRYMNENIHVVDRDFNRNHANVSVLCEGIPCTSFKFTPKCIGESGGYIYQIEVEPQNPTELKSLIKNGERWTFNLAVTDGMHWSTEQARVEINTPVSEDFDEGGTFSSILIYGISGGVVLVILLSCSAIVAYLTMRSRNAKDLLRKLTETEIREFLEGNASFGTTEGKRSVDVNTPIMALPYNHAFEIQREKLRIDETTILGTGAFGIVWKGSVVYSNGESITVAVKTVKRNVGILYFKALLSELKIMAYIGKHPNIVSLVGACTHSIRKREVYIAVQYCSNGNFHNYLKCRRERFTDLVVDGNLQLTNSLAHSHMYSNTGCFSKSISTINLLKWATQIANGLQYLESLGIIHGDLATRNVLLDDERTAKIGDFGLSRRLIDYSNYYYTKTSQAPLPWKWMAPESLRDMRFSKKSDIWSFGIVLWEIFTLGQTPYPGLNWDETFLGRLEKGLRPAKPQFASNILYDLMVDCWNLDPHDRPAILDIKRALENITSSTLRQRTDMSYIKFLGDNERSILHMATEDDQGYLEPNDHTRKNYADA